jgi:hypothetical protein
MICTEGELTGTKCDTLTCLRIQRRMKMDGVLWDSRVTERGEYAEGKARNESIMISG